MASSCPAPAALISDAEGARPVAGSVAIDASPALLYRGNQDTAKAGRLSRWGRRALPPEQNWSETFLDQDYVEFHR